MLPITHSPPRADDEAVELSRAIKQHLGLDDARSWVIVSEPNRFVWPGPDLRPVSPAEASRFDYGPLPPGLCRTIRERFLACAGAQRVKIVRRTEYHCPCLSACRGRPRSTRTLERTPALRGKGFARGGGFPVFRARCALPRRVIPLPATPLRCRGPALPSGRIEVWLQRSRNSRRWQCNRIEYRGCSTRSD